MQANGTSTPPSTLAGTNPSTHYISLGAPHRRASGLRGSAAAGSGAPGMPKAAHASSAASTSASLPHTCLRLTALFAHQKQVERHYGGQLMRGPRAEGRPGVQRSPLSPHAVTTLN